MSGVGSHWPDEAQALAEFRQEMWRRLMEDSLHSWYDMLERQESSATGIEEPDYTPPLPILTTSPSPEAMAAFARWMDRRGRT